MLLFVFVEGVFLSPPLVGEFLLEEVSPRVGALGPLPPLPMAARAAPAEVRA